MTREAIAYTVLVAVPAAWSLLMTWAMRHPGGRVDRLTPPVPWTGRRAKGDRRG